MGADLTTTVTAILYGAICNGGGITVTGRTPVLALCRALLADGHDPATPMQVYRDDVLTLRIRSIGAAAALTVRETTRDGCPRFARWSSGGRQSRRFPARRARYPPAAPVGTIYGGAR